MRRRMFYFFLGIYVCITLGFIGYFESEKEFYSKYEECGIKGCERDIYFETARLYVEKYLTDKFSSSNYSYHLEEATFMNMIKYTVITPEHNEIIIWIKKKPDRYSWSTVFYGDDDTDFLRKL